MGQQKVSFRCRLKSVRSEMVFSLFSALSKRQHYARDLVVFVGRWFSLLALVSACLNVVVHHQ
jgi:hypothetical protein